MFFSSELASLFSCKYNMEKELKSKIFWMANKNLKPLLFILIIGSAILLHQLGIVVMVK